MSYFKIKSHAKLNMALHVTGKKAFLHKLESIVSFIDLHDEIWIKKIISNHHKIIFNGKFSKNIHKQNTISKLLEILEKRKILKKDKFHIKIIKKIPNKAGFGGGSVNAASILKYFVKKKLSILKKKMRSKFQN